MKELFNQKSFKTIELYSVSLTILFYLFRTSIPFLKYPFLIVFSGLILYTVIIHYKRIGSTLKLFISNYFLLLLLVIIVIMAFFLSDKLYLTIFKDIINSLLLLFFFFLLTFYIKTKNDLNSFFQTLMPLVIVISLAISLYDLGNLINFFPDKYPFIINEKPISSFIPPEIDYNFALLPIMFGLICIFYNLTRTNSKLKFLLYDVIFIIYALSIFFSGSRRGMICFLSIISFLLLVQIITLINKNSLLSKYRTVSLYMLLSIFAVSIFFFSLAASTSGRIKNIALTSLGSRNPYLTKTNIAVILYRYKSAIDKDAYYSEFYYKIWSTNWTESFDPKNPDSPWGVRPHKTIYPLTGRNVDMVPRNTKGYYMDKTCNSSTWDSNAYSYTYVGKKINVNKDDIINSSVFCYVSKNFNGDWAKIVIGGAKTGITLGENYNYSCRDTWQKLTCSSHCLKDEIDVLLYFSKNGVQNFSNLEGYIIFAYPQIQLIKNNVDTISLYGNHMSEAIFNTTELNNEQKNEPINMSYGIKRTDSAPMNNCLVKSFHQADRYYKAGFLGSLNILVSDINPETGDKDIIRRLASRFISEDTTYFGYKSNLSIDTLSNNFINLRIGRWKFAWKIFINEFSLKQKFFGGGFNFLNWYGYYFVKDKTISDYPHNPFLSVLLYSGLFGLILYLIFIAKVFYYYAKYYKKYNILFVFFIITFFFSFFSAGSPFDPPMMGFFVILPFFIHSIHERDKKHSLKPGIVE